MMTYEEVITGYKKSLGLLKQIDKQVYKLFIRELNHVGKEEISALMAQLKYNIGVKESIAKGIDKDFKTHRLDKKYIKGKARFLRLAISPSNIFSFELEKTDLFGKKKQFNLYLFPIKPNDTLEETRFATTNALTDGKFTSGTVYKVDKKGNSYTVSKHDGYKNKTSKTSIQSIPEEESTLTTPVIGY